MEKSIRVNILGREYSLRVNEQDVDHTLEIATYLDTKMRAFREAHPNQHEVTTAVITGLAITEELFSVKRALTAQNREFDDAMNALDRRLVTALSSLEPAEGSTA